MKIKKVLATILVLWFMFSANINAKTVFKYKYTFIKIEKNPFDETGKTYVYTIRTQAGTNVSSSLPKTDINVLLQILNVKQLSEIAGKSFYYPNKNASIALKQFLKYKYKYEFIKIFDKICNFYVCEMRTQQNENALGAIAEQDINILLKAMNAKKINDLAGKKFASPKSNPWTAIKWLILDLKSGGIGAYEPPSRAELIAIAGSALAKMTEPDFSNVDPETLWRAFPVTYGPKPAKWVIKLKKIVQDKSKNQVSLRMADYKTFNMRVKGPAYYMELVGNDKIIKVIGGPYTYPIIFAN